MSDIRSETTYMSTQLSCDVPQVIPGYTCTERIGAGGYGEVWKVDAPGGMKKALKIVYGFVGEERAEREQKALDRIKELRHPYMLSLERVEVLHHRLLIVSELADGSLMDRFVACRDKGWPGIPREELIRYLLEAAEALDYLLQQHGLQHLDIKPENLLLLADHAKVADFGLVKDLFDQTNSLVSGLTPVYAAPETFLGQATRWSDQYSLAVVYQQMLTGTLPYPGRQAAQLVTQHAKMPPSLAPLPAVDRATVARALQQRPEMRFDSCRAFVQALQASGALADPVRHRRTAPVAGQRASADEETRSTRGLLTDRLTPSPSPTHSSAQTQVLAPGEAAARLGQPAHSSPNVPRIQVERATRRLPPLSSSEPFLPLQPAVLIGVGGSGARVLARLHDRLQQTEQPAQARVHFMVLDIDGKVFQSLTAGGETHPLAKDAFVFLPLRSPEELRRESDRYLSWLSRRWLYNIRPSQVTSGLRPLGRLAWFDHRARVEKTMRSLLEKAHSPSQLMEAAHSGSSPEASSATAPHILVVGSISGGTGGMLLDVIQAANHLLEETGAAGPHVTAFLLHSATSQIRQRELATANAFASLNELRHLTCYGETYDRRQAPAGSESAPPEWNPLRASYFVHLGTDLNSSSYTSQLEKVVDYLYSNLTTPLGGLLQQCRQPTGEKPLHDVWLRSFRLLGLGPAAAQESHLDKLERFLSSTRLSMYASGYDQRLILLVPQQAELTPQWRARVEAAANVLPARDAGFQLYCEAEKLSLAQIAHGLCRDCPEAEQAAYRLHTRRDIQWSPMARIDE